MHLSKLLIVFSVFIFVVLFIVFNPFKDDCKDDSCVLFENESNSSNYFADSSFTRCSFDSDCTDSFDCTIDSCVNGFCFNYLSCEEDGVCCSSSCNYDPDCFECNLDSDCEGQIENYCESASCVDNVCVISSKTDCAVECVLDIDCDDSDVCTLDTCDLGLCSNVPNCEEDGVCCSSCDTDPDCDAMLSSYSSSAGGSSQTNDESSPDVVDEPIVDEEEVVQIMSYGYAYPQHVHLVSDPALLQNDLDTYGVIRLERGVDYSSAGTIYLSSNQEIYGIGNSLLDTIEVLPGTTNALVSNIRANIYFQETTNPISNNVFMRVQNEWEWINATNSAVVNNTFLDVKSRLYVKDGLFKNNKFIRWRTHSWWPAMLFDSPSATGNVFLWVNVLTPGGDGIRLINFTDMTFVGVDSESWNWNGDSTTDALIDVRGGNTFKIFGFGGGNNRPYATHLINVNSTYFQADGVQVATTNLLSPHIQAQEAVILGLLTGNRLTDYSLSGSIDFMYGVFENNIPSFTQDENEFLSRITSDTPWEKYEFLEPPNPQGDYDTQNLTGVNDSTAYLQNRIDTEDVVLLDPGTYYISSPLYLRGSQGIIGAGMNNTTIIATSDFDMFTLVEGEVLSLTFTDLTLQGGRNGIVVQGNYSNETTYGFIIVTNCFISHVTFRDFSEAGILAYFPEGYGTSLDNALFDHLYFVNNKYGFKQTTLQESPANPGASSLVDKIVFYRSQFINNEYGSHVEAWRAGNHNAWVDSLFENNTVRAMYMTNQNYPMLLLSTFKNNAGSPTIFSNSGKTLIVGSDFSGSTNSFLTSEPFIEGSTFTSSNPLAKIIGYPYGIHIQNSYANISVGSPNKGYFVNNVLLENTTLNKAMIYYNGSVITTLINASSNGAPQLLVYK